MLLKSDRYGEYRMRIIEHLEAYPGSKTVEIATAIGLSKEFTRKLLCHMRVEQDLAPAWAYRVVDDNKKAPTFQQARALRIVKKAWWADTPEEATPKAVAAALGCSQQNARDILRRLCRARILINGQGCYLWRHYAQTR